MATKIRLRRVGRKKQGSFRVVVIDGAAPRDGAYIESLGFYNPRREPAELKLDIERTEHWIGQGALASDTVRSLLRKARAGGDDSVMLVTEPQKRAARPAAPKADASTEAADEAAAEEASKAEEETPEPEGEAEDDTKAEASGTAAEDVEDEEEEEPKAQAESESEAEEEPAAEASGKDVDEEEEQEEAEEAAKAEG